MEKNRISLYLSASIFIMAAIPLSIAFLLLDDILEDALSLSINESTQKILESYGGDLKRLRDLDPDNAGIYKEKFYQVNESLLLYRQPDQSVQVLRKTYMAYFFVLFSAVFLCSLGLSVWVSRKVATAYRKLYDRDWNKAKKIESLRHFDQWQIIAKKLAHEIKNPLTPILVMVSSLPKFYEKGDKEKFADQLKKTEMVVTEEIEKLKAMVHHFTEYSKMPDPVLKEIDVKTFIEKFVADARLAWPDIQLITRYATLDVGALQLDPVLIKQCFQNIVGNAVEANIGQPISVTVTVERNIDSIAIAIENTGASIPAEHIDKLFTLYYSTKSEKENMGLGLAIVKKILLDHGGDINCEPQTSGAKFVIQLPAIPKKAK